MPIVLKSGNLNLLEPSGPVQACNVIALPLPLLKRVPVIVSSMVVGTAADSTFTLLAEKSNNRCEMELDV